MCWVRLFVGNNFKKSSVISVIMSTGESIKNKTYTFSDNIEYGLAIGETISILRNTWILSETVKYVSTSKTEGEVKLRASLRAMSYNYCSIKEETWTPIE
jgi:hypothetical protein